MHTKICDKTKYTKEYILDIMCRQEICDFKKSNPYFWKGDISFRCDCNQGTINCLWQILKTHPKCGEVQIMDTFVSNISWEISFGNICIIWKKSEFLCPVDIECMYYLEIFSLFVFHVKIFCVSNIGIVHYFEIPTILWGGELYHPFLSGTLSIGMVDHHFLVFLTLHNAMMIMAI